MTTDDFDFRQFRSDGEFRNDQKMEGESRIPDDAPFLDEIKRCLRLTRREMEEDPGDMWPRLLGFDAEGKVSWYQIDPSYMASWQDKNLIGTLIVKTCFESKVTVFLSDGFHATPPPGKSFEDMPTDFSQWPRHLRSEALMLAVNAVGTKGWAGIYGYTRDGKDRRIFPGAFGQEQREVRVLGPGRFVFDLTSAKLDAAFRDALLRNREGKADVPA